MTKQHYYKIFTHDWRSPIQGGTPVLAGQKLTHPVFPFTLPEVRVDTTDNPCGAGWNFTKDLLTAARITSYWPKGRSAKCVVVEPLTEVFERGNKLRASQIQIVRVCTEDEIRASMWNNISMLTSDQGIRQVLANEQYAWYHAQSGSYSMNEENVVAGLRLALTMRQLDTWTLQKYVDARVAWDARAAWDARDAWDARAAWVAWAARDARDAWAAWNARAAWAAWDARAWAAQDAWDARVAWGAQAAHDALTLFYVACAGQLTKYPANYLTKGIREAYQFGLGGAMTVAPNTLGYWLRKV